MAFIKFGLGRATSDSAHEIRDGHLTREEGIALVNKFDGEFPQKYFSTFLEYCNINEDYFNAVIDSWRSPHLWGKTSNGEWKLNHNVAGTGLKKTKSVFNVKEKKTSKKSFYSCLSKQAERR